MKDYSLQFLAIYFKLYKDHKYLYIATAVLLFQRFFKRRFDAMTMCFVPY